MRSSGPRSKSVFRRIERWIVGVVMAILAFVIEKAVLRSIKKDGGAPQPPEPEEPFATSRGNEISGG
jgi:hypothetical protein